MGMDWNRKVNPNCVNAANPFHECAEYCSQGAAGVELRSPAPPLGCGRVQNGTRSHEEEVNGSGRRKVDPLCVNAPNPFHECSEQCSPGTTETRRPNGRERSVGKGMRTMEIRKVDPTCVNASNPFHLCSEYCVQKKNENRHINGSNSGSSAPHGSKRDFKSVKRNDVRPNCANASNPFHKCAEYCVQRMNGAV